MNLYASSRESAQYGARMQRELSTTRVAENVWSDVASRRKLGFRSTNGGPLLYGELASGGEIEMGLYEAKDVEPLCTALFVKAREGALAGSLVVRPHNAATRLLGRITRRSDLERFHVRAKPRELCATLLGPEMRSLLDESFDRAPQLHWSGGAITMVFEGVLMVHEQIEQLLDVLSALDAAGHGRGIAPSDGPFR